MPANFDRCVENGGKVRRVRLNDKEYMNVCYPKGGGKGVKGYVKKIKGNKDGK